MTVSEVVKRQAEKCEAEAYALLRKEAENIVFYVAMGNVTRRELAEKFGLTEDHVGGLLSKAAVKLVDQIRNLE